VLTKLILYPVLMSSNSWTSTFSRYWSASSSDSVSMEEIWGWLIKAVTQKLGILATSSDLFWKCGNLSFMYFCSTWTEQVITKSYTAVSFCKQDEKMHLYRCQRNHRESVCFRVWPWGNSVIWTHELSVGSQMPFGECLTTLLKDHHKNVKVLSMPVQCAHSIVYRGTLLN